MVYDQRLRYAEVWDYRDMVTLGDYGALATQGPGLHVGLGRELAALAQGGRGIVLGHKSDRNRFGPADPIAAGLPAAPPASPSARP